MQQYTKHKLRSKYYFKKTSPTHTCTHIKLILYIITSHATQSCIDAACTYSVQLAGRASSNGQIFSPQPLYIIRLYINIVQLLCHSTLAVVCNMTATLHLQFFDSSWGPPRPWVTLPLTERCRGIVADEEHREVSYPRISPMLYAGSHRPSTIFYIIFGSYCRPPSPVYLVRGAAEISSRISPNYSI